MTIYVYYCLGDIDEDTPIFYCSVKLNNCNSIVTATHTFQEQYKPSDLQELNLIYRGEFISYSNKKQHETYCNETQNNKNQSNSNKSNLDITKLTVAVKRSLVTEPEKLVYSTIEPLKTNYENYIVKSTGDINTWKTSNCFVEKFNEQIQFADSTHTFKCMTAMGCVCKSLHCTTDGANSYSHGITKKIHTEKISDLFNYIFTKQIKFAKSLPSTTCGTDSNAHGFNVYDDVTNLKKVYPIKICGNEFWEIAPKTGSYASTLVWKPKKDTSEVIKLAIKIVNNPKFKTSYKPKSDYESDGMFDMTSWSNSVWDIYNSVGFNYDDNNIAFVKSQTHCLHATAVESLKKNGDVTSAILDIKNNIKLANKHYTQKKVTPKIKPIPVISNWDIKNLIYLTECSEDEAKMALTKHKTIKEAIMYEKF